MCPVSAAARFEFPISGLEVKGSPYAQPTLGYILNIFTLVKWSRGAVVEQLTHDLKFGGSNPAAADSGRERN